MTTTPAGRTYLLVLPEITTALFACPDCGAVVWHALRDKHDQLHEQVHALIDTTHTQATQIDTLSLDIERFEHRLDEVRQAADYADTLARRAEDAARDAGYRADDAKRTADDAARSTSRGW